MDGQYIPISKEDAFQNYCPLMIFYKQLNVKNNYFAFNQYASLEKEIQIIEPLNENDENWLDEAERIMNETLTEKTLNGFIDKNEFRNLKIVEEKIKLEKWREQKQE